MTQQPRGRALGGDSGAPLLRGKGARPPQTVVMDHIDGEVRQHDQGTEVARELDRLRAQRDDWIRLFNRLEAAISHHKKATGDFPTDADEALYAARDRVLRASATGENR